MEKAAVCASTFLYAYECRCFFVDLYLFILFYNTKHVGLSSDSFDVGGF